MLDIFTNIWTYVALIFIVALYYFAYMDGLQFGAAGVIDSLEDEGVIKINPNTGEIEGTR